MAPQYLPKAGIFQPLKTSMISSVQSEPLYQSQLFLQQKNVVERLSATQISNLIF